jgi:pyruvate/2-oxoglutarate dehydrogenase complex dihydrolipoamide acyltransferase (E2) component
VAGINHDIVTLAAKAREGKLQPQEFQVFSFLILFLFNNISFREALSPFRIWVIN